jgi:hypothetical protein
MNSLISHKILSAFTWVFVFSYLRCYFLIGRLCYPSRLTWASGLLDSDYLLTGDGCCRSKCSRILDTTSGNRGSGWSLHLDCFSTVISVASLTDRDFLCSLLLFFSELLVCVSVRFLLLPVILRFSVSGLAGFSPYGKKLGVREAYELERKCSFLS